MSYLVLMPLGEISKYVSKDKLEQKIQKNMKNLKLRRFLLTRPSLESLKIWSREQNVDWEEIQIFMHAATLAFVDFWSFREYPKSKNFDPQQIKMGTKVEREHSTLDFVARKIAKDHLQEIPDYYTHLEKMERESGKM